MDKAAFEQVRDKVVKLERRNGFHYQGTIVQLGADFLTFKDKYHQLLVLAYTDITGIEEVSPARRGGRE